jgi:CxxC motif-containing protein (DUF1111 family)
MDHANGAILFMIVLSSGISAQTKPYARNAASCEQCHSVPTKFGSSQLTVQRVGTFESGRFVPSAEGGIRHRHGESTKSSDPATQLMGERVAISLLGDGYIEVIAANDIRNNAGRQRQENLGIQGSIAAAFGE